MSLFQILDKGIFFLKVLEGSVCHLIVTFDFVLRLSFLGRSRNTWSWIEVAKAATGSLPWWEWDDESLTDHGA